MFSGKRMWSYLFGAFLNAVVCSFIPLIIFSEAQTIQGGRQGCDLCCRLSFGAVGTGLLRMDKYYL